MDGLGKEMDARRWMDRQIEGLATGFSCVVF